MEKKNEFVQGGNQIQTFILIGILSIVLLYILQQVFKPKKDETNTSGSGSAGTTAPTTPPTGQTQTQVSASGVANPRYNSSNDNPATRTQQITFLLNLLGYPVANTSVWTSQVENAFTRFRTERNLPANPDALYWIRTMENEAVNKRLLRP